MGRIHCFTSASLGYLDRVRVLAETLRRHHPDWHFSLCLVDQIPPQLNINNWGSGISNVVSVTELGFANPRRELFTHNIVELCTASKGPMLWKLLEGGADKVVYLDPDIAVISDLSKIDTLLDSYDVLLTPHQVQPDMDAEAIRDNEMGSLKHGVYNLGFLAVSSTSEGRRFASWWRDRLTEYCYDDIPNGIFTDQRWCDLAPAFFEGLHILRDPGYNVASWNLSQRPISIGQDGIIKAAQSPLRFFHFTKINGPGEVMLERYSGNRVEVYELISWYRRLLANNAVQGLPNGWYAYGTYSDGTPIPLAHRRLYRDRPDLQIKYPDPFTAGLAAFSEEVGQIYSDPTSL